MERVYVSVNRDVRNGHCHTALIIVLCFALFATISLFMRAAYNDTREDLIEKLRKERQVAAVNSDLKMELAGITRARYLEFAAKEKLGLKKPKEEEVLVLR
jgi:hypothetical protein